MEETDKLDKKRDEIQNYILKLIQKLHISAKQREKYAFFLQSHIVKIKQQKNMVKALQNFVFFKLDKLLLSIKKFIDEYVSIFIYILLLVVNC